jgi:hypothetical protein
MTKTWWEAPMGGSVLSFSKIKIYIYIYLYGAEVHGLHI